MEIVIVGHLSRDLLITPDHQQEVLGGGAAYAMLAPAIGALGAGIVSRVGEDFDQEYMKILKKSGLDLTGLRQTGSRTTRFVNIYDEECNRKQRVEAVASQIRAEDYLDQHLSANIIHFCPLFAGDIHQSSFVHARLSGALTSLDVQGYLRSKDGDQITPRDWEERDVLLTHIDILKLDDREVPQAFGTKSLVSAATYALDRGPRVVIITRDRKGSIIFTRNAEVDIPLVLAENYEDQTGCGDVYTIGFLLEYMRAGDIRRSGLFGATCASFNVESVGPYKMPNREQVEERMKHYLQA